MFKIENLYVRYQNSTKWIIQDFSANINPNELILFVGASGSGKSTLAKAIMGIIPYFEPGLVNGEINYNNNSLSNSSREEMVKNVGYISQYPADFTIQMLVEDEIAFPLENLGIESEKIEKRITTIMAQLGISHLRNNLMTELSSGELQRVALATALVSKPSVVLLDEPFSRIDPKSEMRFANLLRKMANNGQIILVFDHRLDYILPHADKVFYLVNGEKAIEETPEKVIEHLVNVDVPEVSAISNLSGKKMFLSIEQAFESLKDYLNKR